MKEHEAISTIFFKFGSNMLRAKRITHVFYGFSEFKCQIMPRAFAESWPKS